MNLLRAVLVVASLIVVFSDLSSAGECADASWLKFGTTKCYKLLSTYEEFDAAVKECSALKATLVAIKSVEEQEFIFNNIVSGSVYNAWLGAKSQDDNKFAWLDGPQWTYSTYTHWSPNPQSPNAEVGEECVQMEADSTHDKGYWIDKHCYDHGVAVCEMAQTTGTGTPPSQDGTQITELQKAVAGLRKDLDNTKYNYTQTLQQLSKAKTDLIAAQIEINRLTNTIKQNNSSPTFPGQTPNPPGSPTTPNAELESIKQKLFTTQNDLAQAKRDISAALNDILALKRTSGVPIGFIYTELPGQSSPRTLWPTFTWSEVSSTYAGLFFRVMGGKSGCFGCAQTASTQRISKIESSGKNDCGSWTLSNLLAPGTTSRYIRTGGNNNVNIGLKFTVSNDEIRPANKAVRLWKRIA